MRRRHPTDEFRDTIDFIENGGFAKLPAYRRRDIHKRRDREKKQGWTIPPHEIPSTVYANPEAKRARLRSVIAEHTHLQRNDFMIVIDVIDGIHRPRIYRIDRTKGQRS